MKNIKHLLFFLGIVSLSYAYAELPPTAAPQETETQTSVDSDAASSAASASMSDLLQEAAQQHSALWYLLLLAFLAGMLASFTPCVYPMIPLTVGILQAQGAKTLWYNFFSATAYVSGIALVYAALGYVSATASVFFGAWVVNPWVMALVILFLLYLAFSLFGFYEIYMPRFLAHRSEVHTQGSLLKIFFFGMISGTVASPCLTPALAVLLTLVAKMGDPLIGFLVLLFFALGMSMLLLVIGTFSGAVSLLPHAGKWMVEVKAFMGFCMFGVMVYLVMPLISMHVDPRISETTAWVLYGLVTLGASVYFVVSARGNKIKMLIGLLLGLCALGLFGVGIKMIF